MAKVMPDVPAVPEWQPVHVASPGAPVRWLGGTELLELDSLTEARIITIAATKDKRKIFFIV
jgi:hypothetical protein